MKNIELIIKTAYIVSKRSELVSLNSKISGSKISMKLTGSKGSLADEINNAIDRINSATKQIGDFVNEATVSVLNISTKFEETDSKMADVIYKMWVGVIMKKTICLFLLLLLILTGCAKQQSTLTYYDFESQNTEQEESMDSLNSRQIEICEQMNLPINIEELTDSQKKSLMRIEELLQHLDKKYDTTFHYVGYYEKSVLEEEKIEAYSDGLNEYYYTTLTVQEDGSYNDDYKDVLGRCLLEIEAADFLNSNLDSQFKVFALECKYSGEKVPKTINDFSNNTSLTIEIIVKGKDKVDKLQEYAKKVIEWYQKNNIYGYVNFIMVSDEHFDSVNNYNVSSIKIDDNTDIALSCDIYSNGKTKIY